MLTDHRFRIAAVALLACLTTQEVRGQEIVVTLLGTGSLSPEVGRFGPSITAGTDSSRYYESRAFWSKGVAAAGVRPIRGGLFSRIGYARFQ